MQFIEKNSLDVRSAVYHLQRGVADPKFVLFPMIHVGTKEFYEEVSRRLTACDLVVLEGVDSKKASLLTLSYRVVRKIKRMDLVTQQEGLKIAGLRQKIVNLDMKRREFDEGWSSLPFVLKLQLLCIIPCYVVYLFLFGTRETIAEYIALDDLPSAEEILFKDEIFEKLDALLVDDRDRKLVGGIGGLRSAGSQAQKTIAIVYGAQHMRQIMAFLLGELKYRVEKANWVTVFDL